MHLRGRAGVSIGNQWDKLVKSRVKIRNTYRKFYTDSNQNVIEENKKLTVQIEKKNKNIKLLLWLRILFLLLFVVALLLLSLE